MCSRHATVFIPAQRVVAADDDQWWDDLTSKKAFLIADRVFAELASRP